MEILKEKFVKIKVSLLFVLLVAFPLCLINSFVLVVRTYGFEELFWQNWMHVFVFNFSITYPLALIIVPFAKEIVHRIN